MRDDLTMVRGEFVVWGLWVAAVGEVVVQGAEVFHVANSVRIIGVKVARHKNLINGFEHAPEG